MEDRSENKLEIIRATETWQQAGAYYVRIQAMAKKHHITLRREFDDHDTQDTRYIVVTDDGFPVATARIGNAKNGQKNSAFAGRSWKAGIITSISICRWAMKSAGKRRTGIPSAAFAWRRNCKKYVVMTFSAGPYARLNA